MSNQVDRLVRRVLASRGGSTQHAARSREGMNDLANIVLNSYRDIKRVTNAIAPQSAAELVRKHNEKSPNHPWRLLKKDPEGPDTIDNLGDLNNDGVPDVVIQDQNRKPVFINGYTTRRSNWPDDLLYYSAYPTKEDRMQLKVDQQNPLYSKKDFVRDFKNVEYWSPDNAPDPDAVGDIKSTNVENIPEWYQDAATKYKFTAPKRLSSYKRYQTYVFKPAFAEATERLARDNHIILDGKTKMILFAKLSGSFYTRAIYAYLNERGDLSEEEIDKVRKNKEIKKLIDDYITDLIRRVRNEEGFYQGIVQMIYEGFGDESIQALLPPPAA